MKVLLIGLSLWLGAILGAIAEESKETLAGLSTGDSMQKAIQLWGNYRESEEEGCYWCFGNIGGVTVTLQVLPKEGRIALIELSAAGFPLNNLSRSTLEKLASGRKIILGSDHKKVEAVYMKYQSIMVDWISEATEGGSFGLGYLIGDDVIVFGFDSTTQKLTNVTLAQKGSFEESFGEIQEENEKEDTPEEQLAKSLQRATEIVARMQELTRQLKETTQFKCTLTVSDAVSPELEPLDPGQWFSKVADESLHITAEVCNWTGEPLLVIKLTGPEVLKKFYKRLPKQQGHLFRHSLRFAVADLPVGQYKAEVFLEQKLFGSASFEIWAPPKGNVRVFAHTFRSRKYGQPFTRIDYPDLHAAGMERTDIFGIEERIFLSYEIQGLNPDYGHRVVIKYYLPGKVAEVPDEWVISNEPIINNAPAGRQIFVGMVYFCEGLLFCQPGPRMLEIELDGEVIQRLTCKRQKQ